MRKLVAVAFTAALAAPGMGMPVHALPGSGDRVYTADQNSNTVSVINAATNTLLGQIRLGNVRPDVLSPLYKGEINVHGLGFSPDHRTLLVVSTGSNAVTFVDTATNKVKGTTYVGRSPHEGSFTPDGKEAWVVVRGEDYLSVIDPATLKEKERITTTPGPGMVIFDPNGKYAYVCNSFNPVFEVVDVGKRQVVKKIPVASPFSPFLQITPDRREVWLTHKDVGKVTRIDLQKFEARGVIDTGFITNHLSFARTGQGTLAYVTVGGENVVKVFTTDDAPRLVATIRVGPLPHGIWTSDDSSRVFVGIENGDAVNVIDTAANKVVARIPIGQAPQGLVFVSGAVPSGEGNTNLSPRPPLPEAVNIALKPPSGDAKGFVVARNLGLVDALEVNVFKLRPDAVYSVYAGKQKILGLKTNAKGMAAGSAIGSLREIASRAGSAAPGATPILVMEGEAPPASGKAVLESARSTR